jgi:hypothetical protein
VIRTTSTGVEIEVRVIPRAGNSGVAGTRDGRLLIRLAAAPVDGGANEALVTLLATYLDCPKRSIRIVAGDRSRTKRVAIDGLGESDLRLRLALPV